MRVSWVRLVASFLIALLSLISIPVGVLADTCACDPIQPYLVVDRFDETHVTYRNADSPGIVYASNKSGAWVRSKLTSRIDIPYAIAVDRAQKVYIVFRREQNDAVHFFLISNRTGSWVTTRLSTIQDGAYDISIQADPARNLHLTWGTDERVWYATNKSGAWARRGLDTALGQNANLAIDDQGHVHLGFNQCLEDGPNSCADSGVTYQTNASGAWVTQRLSTDPEDHVEDLLVDPNGKVHLVFAREYESVMHPGLPLGIYYMTNASGRWRTLKAAGPGRMVNIERGPAGQIHITYAHVDGNLGIFWAMLKNGVWTRTEVITEYAMYPSTGIESNGRMHLAFMRMAIDPGIYHALKTDAGWSRLELMD